MSEIKLFNIATGTAVEIDGEAGGLEKSLQTLFENNLEALLGIRFLKSEHSTGHVHGGRIDTLGIDENDFPVILEYKRAVSENVINQGLYYLDWLMDHKADFKLLVMEKVGKDAADAIDWSGPRLICIAADFTKYDEHSVRQINRNIDLVRYKRFGRDLLALELATSVTSAPPTEVVGTSPKRGGDKPVAEALSEMTDEMRTLYDELRAFMLGLGDDVSEKPLKLYIAFKRLRNFATVCVQKKDIQLYLHLNPESVDIDERFMRDVRQIGHWGTGDLEVRITDAQSLNAAQPLIVRAYEGS